MLSFLSDAGFLPPSLHWYLVLAQGSLLHLPEQVFPVPSFLPKPGPHGRPRTFYRKAVLRIRQPAAIKILRAKRTRTEESCASFLSLTPLLVFSKDRQVEQTPVPSSFLAPVFQIQGRA